MVSNLMQFSGSWLQKVLHPNRVHDNQPMGGVKASPLSNPSTAVDTTSKSGSNFNMAGKTKTMHMVGVAA